MTIRCFQVPTHDQMPSEEMIEWLHEMTQEWDGDESGIVIFPPVGSNGEVGEEKIAGPGDYIVSVNGTYHVLLRDELDKQPDLLKNLGVEKVE
jgi:hypothetical protein